MNRDGVGRTALRVTSAERNLASTRLDSGTMKERLSQLACGLVALALLGCDSSDAGGGAGGGGGTGGSGGVGSGGVSGTGGAAGAGGSPSGGAAGVDAGSGGTSGPSAGKVRYSEHTSPEDDKYLLDAATWSSFYQTHTERLVVFSPFFDDKLAAFPPAYFYQDLYAIYAGSALLAAHPEWVLVDGQGKKLFIPWGCSGGTCPQYAADFTNAAFRSDWITRAKATLAAGYKGIWIDDVNLDFRVGDGNGDFVAPIDPATGAAMQEDAWRAYMATFVTEIRAAMPKAEIVHNSIWYAGGPSRHAHPSVKQQILAADYLCIEGGFVDSGLTGGSGSFSAEALRGYVDAVHATSRKILLMGSASDPAELEYSLASYFLMNDGDLLAHQANMTPESWWPGNDADLGPALGPRTTESGVRRRNFANGVVLVADPGTPAVKVPLSGAFQTLTGQTVTEVVLGPKQGAVLRK